MNNSFAKTAKLQLVAAMLIFGTIGIFVRYIPLASSVVALVRGVVGSLALLLLARLRKTPLSPAAIRRNLLLLTVSGIFIGFNWILLFEAYRYTTVATATLCYYLAPVFVILASPLVLQERLTLRKLLCVAGALIGMVFVSGVLDSGFSGSSETLGILCGVGAAILYAGVILMNKRLTDIPALDRTVVQLGAASAALLPYVLITEWGAAPQWSPLIIALLLVVGLIHTGIAYTLYFGSIRDLPAQTSAIFSYIDPVSAIFLSAIFLRETLTLSDAIGAALVLGSTLLSELHLPRRAEKS